MNPNQYTAAFLQSRWLSELNYFHQEIYQMDVWTVLNALPGWVIILLPEKEGAVSSKHLRATFLKSNFMFSLPFTRSCIGSQWVVLFCTDWRLWQKPMAVTWNCNISWGSFGIGISGVQIPSEIPTSKALSCVTLHQEFITVEQNYNMAYGCARTTL